MNIHATRRTSDGTRVLYTEHRLLRGRPWRVTVGTIGEDWCQDDEGCMCYGYFWKDLNGDCGRTFYRLRDCKADFSRELADRNGAAQ